MAIEYMTEIQFPLKKIVFGIYFLISVNLYVLKVFILYRWSVPVRVEFSIVGKLNIFLFYCNKKGFS